MLVLQMAQAVFSLARKISPCVVFLDEIDTILRRDESFSGPSNAVLGILLSAWDGMTGEPRKRVLSMEASSVFLF